MSKKNFNEVKSVSLTAVVILIIIFIGYLISSSFYTVRTGEVAIISSWGKVTRIDREGLNFKIPIVQTKENMIVREKIYDFNHLSVSTKDIQTVLLDLTIQASVSDPEKLYKSFKGLHEQAFIVPRTKEVVQASISKYTIEEFVSRRQELSNIIFQDLKNDFKKYGLSVSNVSIVNHDFSQEYEKAIEAKKVAEQEVEKARFEQEKIRVEAENRVILAQYKLKEKELQAKANLVEANSLSNLLLKKMAIEKWDGKLPKVSGTNATPFLKIEE